MLPCIPCPGPVRHVARAVHRRVLRPIGHRLHHVIHHAPRVIVFGCCAAAVGGMGAAIVAPPGGFFPAPASAAQAAPYVPASASQGWPEMPGWSIVGSGPIAPPYAHTARLPVSYPGYLPTYSPRPVRNVPEPSTLALLLLPLIALPVLRRVK